MTLEMSLIAEMSMMIMYFGGNIKIGSMLSLLPTYKNKFKRMFERYYIKSTLKLLILILPFSPVFCQDYPSKERDEKLWYKSYDLNPESAPMLYFEYDF